MIAKLYPRRVAFYEATGFDVNVYDGGGFAFVTHGDESVLDLGTEADMDPATNSAGCYVIVADVDAWHAALTYSTIRLLS